MKKIIVAATVAAALCSTFALAACDGEKDRSPAGTHTYKITTAEGFDRFFDKELSNDFNGRYYFSDISGNTPANIGTRSESTLYIVPKLDIASFYEGTVTFSASYEPVVTPGETNTRDASVLVDRTVELGSIGYLSGSKYVGSQKIVVDNSASMELDKTYDEKLDFTDVEYTVKSCDITVTMQNDNALGINGYESVSFKLDLANFSNYLNVMTRVSGPNVYYEGEEGYDAMTPHKHYWQKFITVNPLIEAEFREVTLKFDDNTTANLTVTGEYTNVDDAEKLAADPGKAPMLTDITGEVVLYPGTEAYLDYWTWVHTYREIVDGR